MKMYEREISINKLERSKITERELNDHIGICCLTVIPHDSHPDVCMYSNIHNRGVVTEIKFHIVFFMIIFIYSNEVHGNIVVFFYFFFLY